jgi:hypothetical protein
MKVLVTRKFVEEHHKTIIKVGYCDLQFLLRYKNPSFYTTNIYGWASDVYVFGDVAIVTGYAPFGIGNYELTKKYEKMAMNVSHKETNRREIDVYLKEYIEFFRSGKANIPVFLWAENLPNIDYYDYVVEKKGSIVEATSSVKLYNEGGYEIAIPEFSLLYNVDKSTWRVVFRNATSHQRYWIKKTHAKSTLEDIFQRYFNRIGE